MLRGAPAGSSTPAWPSSSSAPGPSRSTAMTPRPKMTPTLVLPSLNHFSSSAGVGAWAWYFLAGKSLGGTLLRGESGMGWSPCSR